MYWTTIVFLIFMFIGLYLTSFFIILILKNRKTFFSSPALKKIPSVTIITPVYNEESSVKETVEAIMSLNYPKDKLEYIVVNDGSKDRTKEIVEKLVKKYSNLKLINKKNSGKADSLNVAIRQAKGKLIGVADADSMPEPQALINMVGFFNDKKVAAVTSAVFLRNTEKFFRKIQDLEYTILAFTRKLLDYVDSVYVTNGPLSVYRASAVREVGGFDPKNITEDIEITWHLISKGYKTRMSLDSKVTTITPQTFKGWWKQRVRWGAGGLQTTWKYRRFFFKKGVFGWFIMPFISISMILAILGFFFFLYLILRKILLTYLSAKLSVEANLALLTMRDLSFSPPVLIYYLVILFFMSFIYGSYVLNTMGKKEFTKFKLGAMSKRLFYMFVYLTFYPLVWLGSFWKLLNRNMSW